MFIAQGMRISGLNVPGQLHIIAGQERDSILTVEEYVHSPSRRIQKMVRTRKLSVLQMAQQDYFICATVGFVMISSMMFPLELSV